MHSSFRQIKEKNRQITTLKKAQNLEKEKQHQKLNESKKSELSIQIHELQVCSYFIVIVVVEHKQISSIN